MLCQNKHVVFWKQQISRNQQKFDKHFIDLLNAMLAYDVLHRPSIPEISSCEWLKGKTATQEEVKEYFTNLKSSVDKAQEQQKINQDRARVQNRMAQANMQNLAFGNQFQASRGDRSKENDEEFLLKKCKIESELKKLDLDKFKFNLADLSESRKPSVLISGLEAKNLLEV